MAETTTQPMTLEFALMLLATSEMTPFEESDFWAFAGVESKTPLIGESSYGYTLILDGTVVNIIGMRNGDETGEVYVVNLSSATVQSA